MHGYQPAALPRLVGEAERLAQAALPEGLAERIQATGGPTWNRLPVEAVQHLAGAAGPGSPLGAGFTRRREAAKASSVGTMTNTNLASSRLRVFACDPMIPTLASYRANPGVVRAFRRVAGKDTRACILCLALDGQEQPTGELLATHPRCRCAVVPVTRAWEELGFPSEVQKLADEAEASRPGQTQERGEAWFAKQTAETQRAMLGPGGFALYQQGARLRDFVAVEDSPDWGPTLRRKPLAEVGNRGGRGGGTSLPRPPLRPGGYRGLTPDDLIQAVAVRGVDDATIARVHGQQSQTDPAGMLAAPSVDDVRLVAAYLNKVQGRIKPGSETWDRIAAGHPAARAIFFHELRELAALEALGVDNPLVWALKPVHYWPAHARASWEEAHYWSAWARAEGQDIPPEAFLLAHPERRANEDEIDRIRRQLRSRWNIGIRNPGSLSMEAAASYYRSRGIIGP